MRVSVVILPPLMFLSTACNFSAEQTWAFVTYNVSEGMVSLIASKGVVIEIDVSVDADKPKTQRTRSKAQRVKI